jgi:outer membrane protein assembly factor BamB
MGGALRHVSLSSALAFAAIGCSGPSPTGSVEHVRGNDPVVLDIVPSTLDSLSLDGGASCASPGDPSTGLDGGAACTGALAPSVFQYAVCTCGSLNTTGAFTTDAYDSTVGPPTGGLGGNVGVDTNVTWGASSTIGGNLFSPGGLSASKGGLVRGDLHLGGTAKAAQTLTVDGNAFVVGPLPASFKVLGSVSHVSSVTAPCDCVHQVPTTSLVNAHKAPNNGNASIGLSLGAAGGGNASRIDLPCGSYSLTDISPSNPLTIAVHGHTALYVAGAVNSKSPLTFSIDPAATLDLFVAGTFEADAALTLGSVASPSHCRVYVAGAGFKVPSNATLACNIYAPAAAVALPSAVEYGSVFANSVTATSGATLHYDTSIEETSGECCSASLCDDGNACTADSCNTDGTCAHTPVVNGTSCTGTNKCDESYSCQAGVCTGSNPVTCPALDSCHAPGACDPTSGTCSSPTLADGTECTGTNLCDSTYACLGGVCTGSNPVTCVASGPCQLASCDPETGSCAMSNAPDGTSCDDGNPCTVGDACTGGVCIGALAPPIRTGSTAVAFQIDPAHTGSQPGDQLTLPLCKRWSLPQTGLPSYPVVAGGRVFVVNEQVQALDEMTGASLWGPVSLAPNLGGHATYDNAQLFVLANSGDLTAFDPTSGQVIWHTALQQIPLVLGTFSDVEPQWIFFAPPTASNGIVFVVGFGLGSTLYAIDEASGSLLWTANQDDSLALPPAVSATRVYLPDACSFADSYDTVSGALVWGTPLCLQVPPTSPVSFFGGDVYVLNQGFGSGSGILLDGSMGTKLGTFSAAQLPAFSEGTYYYDLGGQLVASPLGSSTATWTFAGDQAMVTAPLAVGSQVVVGSSNGNVYVVDAASGQLLSSDNVGASISESSGPGTANVKGFAAADGMLFVSTDSSIVAY